MKITNQDDLRLIVFDNAKDLGEKINNKLVEMREGRDDYRIKFNNCRFSSGEGKIKLQESVREKDVYILSDIGNYQESFIMRGFPHQMSPDEHVADIERAIGACSDHASRLSLIMPLLYESRQHKRTGRESLDCANFLQKMEWYGVRNIVTFDVHDPSIDNAIPRRSFDNFYASGAILEKLYEDEIMNENNFIVLAPDKGAMERARYYGDMLGNNCPVGMFNKRRDYSKIVDGRNPILKHEYLGPDIKGRVAIIVDDMISSGDSIIEVAKYAKEAGAAKVLMCTTFALFASGPELFEKAYEAGLFDKLYSTNLSYVPESVIASPWYEHVDSSEKIARIINNLNLGLSLDPIHNDNEVVYRRLHPNHYGH